MKVSKNNKEVVIYTRPHETVSIHIFKSFMLEGFTIEPLAKLVKSFVVD